MDYPSSAYATHGRALKRHQNKGEKNRLQIYYKTLKPLKKVLTNDIIKSEKERMAIKMKKYTRKPRLSRKTINRLMGGETVKKGIYEYSVEQQWNEELNGKEEILLRWNEAIKDYKCWAIGAKGLYEFED